MAEAHRHPYIEALGTMCPLKLRRGSDFCTTAGSCWRLIFVYTLMPWMQRYRVVGTAVDGKCAAEDFDNEQGSSQPMTAPWSNFRNPLSRMGAMHMMDGPSMGAMHMMDSPTLQAVNERRQVQMDEILGRPTAPHADGRTHERVNKGTESIRTAW